MYPEASDACRSGLKYQTEKEFLCYDSIPNGLVKTKNLDEDNCNLVPEGSETIAGLDRNVNDTKPSFSPDIGKPNLILADNAYRFWCPPKQYPTVDNKCDAKCSEPYYTDTEN